MTGRERAYSTSASSHVSFRTASDRGRPSFSSVSSRHAANNRPLIVDNESLLATDHGSEAVDLEDEKSPELDRFAYGFWAPELAHLRKQYLIPVVMTTILMCCAVWLFFSLYWASLYKVMDCASNLSGWVINRDQNTIGNTIEDALLNATNSGSHVLTWISRDPNLNPTEQSVRHAVDPGYETWIVVDIPDGITEALQNAQRNADANWDPSRVVNMFYADARSYQTYPSMIVTPTLSVLHSQSDSIAQRIAVETLGNNASALQNTLRNAPQTLIGPIGVNQINMHPWDNPVAIAPTFVGMIYLLILAFQVTMASFMARQGIKNHLTFRAYLCMRFCTPAVAYIFISLMVSLLNIAFELPYGAAFPYGGGFMTWWCLSYTGMLVCGLVLESVITLIGPKFIGIFLVFFIISNVSVANYPPEVMNRFFHYAYAMPFYQMRQVYTMILFNTGKHIEILKYFGILWAWIALLLLTMPVIVWIDYNRVRHSRLHGDGTAVSH